MDLRNYNYQSDLVKKFVAQGMQEIIRTLLEQRFGELPANVVVRLDKAGVNALRAWGRRVLTAASLDDVFTTDRA